MKLKPLAASAAIAVAAPASAITVLDGSVDAAGSHQFVTQDGYVFAGKGLYNVTATFSGVVTERFARFSVFFNRACRFQAHVWVLRRGHP